MMMIEIITGRMLIVNIFQFLLLITCYYQNNNNVVVVYGQEEPFVTVNKFDTTINYRTNVCDRQKMLYNNTIEFPDVLRGLNLTVAITNYQRGREIEFFSLDQDNKIPEKNPGYYTIILDELAVRAGFTWRNTYAVYEPRNQITDGNKTWTDILLWSIEIFDISMEKWGHSIDRVEAGVSFPIGFWDSSIVLGEIFKPNQEKRVVNLWSFLDPFEPTVWFMIVAAILFSGFFYWALEHWDVNRNSNEVTSTSRPLASVFHAAITATGHFELNPNSHAARILGFSFSFWALIVASAYTANLASFLVSPSVSVYKVSSISDAIRTDSKLCVQEGGIVQNILKDKYPRLQMIGKDSEQDIFTGLRLPIERGGCNAVAHQLNSFEIYERTKTVNYDCSVSSEKKVVEVLPAGLATIVDTGTDKCTSLISHVLDYHLTVMMNDGFLERAWADHLDRVGTIECIKENTGNVGAGCLEDDTYSLTVQDVGGIFIVHAVLSILALLLATYQFYQKSKTSDINNTRTLSSIYGITQAKKNSSKLARLLSNSKWQKGDDNDIDDEISNDDNGIVIDNDIAVSNTLGSGDMHQDGNDPIRIPSSDSNSNDNGELNNENVERSNFNNHKDKEDNNNRNTNRKTSLVEELFRDGYLDNNNNNENNNNNVDISPSNSSEEKKHDPMISSRQ